MYSYFLDITLFQTGKPCAFPWFYKTMADTSSNDSEAKYQEIYECSPIDDIVPWCYTKVGLDGNLMMTGTSNWFQDVPPQIIHQVGRTEEHVSCTVCHRCATNHISNLGFDENLFYFEFIFLRAVLETHKCFKNV